MRGGECPYVDRWDDYLVVNSNANNHEWLNGWCEISNNVIVWYYALDTILHQYTILDIILEDMRYMNEYDSIRGMFIQLEYNGFGVKRTERQVLMEIN